MTRYRNLAALGSLVLLTLAACGGQPAPQDGPTTGDPAAHGTQRGAVSYQPAVLADAPRSQDVAGAATDLGVAMLRASDSGRNLVTSPASLVLALAMVTEGAEGRTLTELEEALGARGQERTDALSALQAALQEYDGEPRDAVGEELPPEPIAQVANNVVVDDQAHLHGDYLDLLTGAYDAGVEVTDLASQTGKDLLDEWVRQHTGGLIDSSAIEPDPDLAVVLQNAVLFAAGWQDPFPEHRTRDRTFTLADGTPIELPMMTRTGSMPYAESGGWQAARLAYTDGFHADVLLPPEGSGPGELTAELLTGLDRALTGAAQEIELSIPRVEVDSSQDLVPVLAEAGIQDAFDPQRADFGGISAEPLVVSALHQQGVLRIGEEGTVAAAVTELAMETTSMVPDAGPPPMVVDRPFVFRLTHTATGLDLFLAAVADPRG